MRLTEQGLEQLIQLVKESESENLSIGQTEYGTYYIEVYETDWHYGWTSYKIYLKPSVMNSKEYVVDIESVADNGYDYQHDECTDWWQLSEVLKFIKPYIKKAE